MPANRFTKLKGFSLIELIAGIVVFSAVMVSVINLVTNQSNQSIDPIWQTRASELAESLAAEISSKAFDNESAMAGGTGLNRCGDSIPSGCTPANRMGPEIVPSGAFFEPRDQYNDVDDYNGLSGVADSLGAAIEDGGLGLYTGFSVSIRVFYDSNLDGINDAAIGNAKLISITVTTPGGDDITYSFYRWDY